MATVRAGRTPIAVGGGGGGRSAPVVAFFGDEAERRRRRRRAEVRSFEHEHRLVRVNEFVGRRRRQVGVVLRREIGRRLGAGGENGEPTLGVGDMGAARIAAQIGPVGSARVLRHRRGARTTPRAARRGSRARAWPRARSDRRRGNPRSRRACRARPRPHRPASAEKRADRPLAASASAASAGGGGASAARSKTK